MHKPLLVLYAIGQAGRSADRLLPFHQVDRDLTALLKEFGPPRRTVHTEYPFWRLQNDGIWEVAKADTLRRRESNSDPVKSELLAKDIHGGFLQECFSFLRRNAAAREKIVQGLLHAHFPESIHSDVLSAAGLSTGFADYAIEKRNQQFRKDVLRVYNYRCCVCGYDLRLGTQFIGLEAAHIKWFQAGGPDDVENGIALCVLHHKLFDLGAFTLDPQSSVIICSQELSDSSRSEWMLNFHGAQVQSPQHHDYAPKPIYLSWHMKQVFRSPGRRHAHPADVPII